MMLSARYLLGILVAAAMLPSCSTLDVGSDYDPTTDFLRYKTFAVKRDVRVPDDVLAKNDFTQKRVFAAIESVMMEKGLRVVAPDSAELIVLTYAGVKDKVNYDTYGYRTGGYWGPYGYPGLGGGYATQTVVNHYQEGTLHIDLFDQQKKELVWKGWGRGVLSDGASPQERQQMVTEAVVEILDAFPPQK
jgi:hypothetical protein